RFHGGGGSDHADSRGLVSPGDAQSPLAGGRRRSREERLMEATIAIAIGVLFGSGVWLILRPRSFQVLTGLLLMSYAVNLFIFIMGHLWVNMPPLTIDPGIPDPSDYADPLPQ